MLVRKKYLKKNVKEEVVSIVEKFCKQWKLTVTVSDSFAAYIDYPEIEISFIQPESLGFMENLRNNYWLNCPYTEFTMSMLHEIGHTQDKVKVYANITRKREEIEKMPFSPEAEKMYFNLPPEDRATSWAVQFAAHHPRKMANFDNKIKKLLYKKGA